MWDERAVGAEGDGVRGECGSCVEGRPGGEEGGFVHGPVDRVCVVLERDEPGAGITTPRASVWTV